MKKALYSVRSSKKDSGYPKSPVDFVSSTNLLKAKEEWIEAHPDHTIWTFDFVMYV